MYDTSKLRGRIVEKYGSQSAFADASGNSVTFISQYMNGKTQLTQATMDKWIGLLDIADNDIRAYFFTLRVHETELRDE